MDELKQENRRALKLTLGKETIYLDFKDCDPLPLVYPSIEESIEFWDAVEVYGGVVDELQKHKKVDFEKMTEDERKQTISENMDMFKKLLKEVMPTLAKYVYWSVRQEGIELTKADEVMIYRLMITNSGEVLKKLTILLDGLTPQEAIDNAP